MTFPRWLRHHLFLILGIGAAAAARGELPPGYSRLEREGVFYHVLRVAPAQADLAWLGADGKPIRRMDRLKADLGKKGVDLLALMNAGIYEPGGIPSGLHVQDGRELRPLNLGSAKGNFYLKPNGVFAITAEGKALVMESTAYAAAGLKPRLALQSGPVLLWEGRVHPQFSPTGTSRLYRNGIGVVAATGEVVLAMTEVPQKALPNMHMFAEFFRAQGCENALFLDGDISEIYVPGVPALERLSSNELGAFLIVRREKNPR
jgi:uncharacterized protein YigE (DUF2233 family)